MKMIMPKLTIQQKEMVGALTMADEGPLITKRKIELVTRKFISKKKQTAIKREVVVRIGMDKMQKMGKKKVLRVVQKEIRKEAVNELKEIGFKSACQGACGRRMHVVAEKIKAERKKSEHQIIKL